MEQKDIRKLRGQIEIIVKDKFGKLKKHLKLKNTITNAGLAEAANLLIGAGTAFSYLALGIGTTPAVVGDTALESEIVDSGLQRAVATLTRVTTNVANDTAKFDKTFTATGAKAITEVGILNNSSGGTLLGRRVFSAINTESGDTVQILYSVINS